MNLYHVVYTTLFSTKTTMPLLGNATLPPGIIFSGSPDSHPTFSRRRNGGPQPRQLGDCRTPNQSRGCGLPKSAIRSPQDHRRRKSTRDHRVGQHPQDSCLPRNGSNHGTPHEGSVEQPPRRNPSGHLHGQDTSVRERQPCLRRAMAANPDPASIAHMNIMAEPIESPENTSVEIIQLVYQRHHRKYDASPRTPTCQAILVTPVHQTPGDMSVRSYLQHLRSSTVRNYHSSHLSKSIKRSLTMRSRRSYCS